MKQLEDTKKALDTFQQEHKYLAFPVAVVKRYGDDGAGKLAALITYYSFLALFPLILVFISVLGIVVSGNPELQQRISAQVFQYFPSLGHELRQSVHTLKGSSIAIGLQLLVLFYGARGMAAMLQEAFNSVWHVDKKHRPGFVGDHLRSFGMMASIGLVIITGTVIGYILDSLLDFGVISRIMVTALNLVVTLGLFLAVFRLGTSARIGWKSIMPGVIIAAVGVLIVQHFGSYIMAHQLPKLNGTYGSFALALAMMFWIYLQAQIIMYAVVISAVRSQRDWPKKLF